MTIIHLYLFGNLYLAKSPIQKRVKFEKHAHLIIIVKLLALALTNLVLDLANLVTKLAKPSLG